MNFNESGESIIPVLELVYSSPHMPKKEKVKGQWKQRIRRPFERSMDHLQDIGFSKWFYCNKQGEIIKREDVESMTYEEFTKLFVHYNIKGYPTEEEIALMNLENAIKSMGIESPFSFSEYKRNQT